MMNTPNRHGPQEHGECAIHVSERTGICEDLKEGRTRACIST